MAESAGARRCPTDGTVYRREGGIWRFLACGRGDVAPFLHQYRTVRRAEGWGSATPAYYRALPFEDRSGRQTDIWRIRAITYLRFLEWVLAPLEARGRPARLVDLGAGNGWLAARLTERGHEVAAVDLDDDPRDGLGAVMHYGKAAPAACVQASFDALPWSAGVFDLAIYNGSLHYSPDYARTMAEASRVLGEGGQVAILDTPFYRDAASGETMVRERTRHFRDEHGLSEVAVGEAFLTDARLAELGRALDIEWRVLRPYYGLRWTLRPLVHRLLGRRAPVRFRLVVGSRHRANRTGVVA